MPDLLTGLTELVVLGIVDDFTHGPLTLEYGPLFDDVEH